MSAADMLSGLHSTIAAALRPHLALPAAAPLVLFHARCGRKPSFRSIGDAEAYERGWRAWPAPSGAGEYATPQANGWLDHECEDVVSNSSFQIATDEAKAEAHEERKEREL